MQNSFHKRLCPLLHHDQNWFVTNSFAYLTLQLVKIFAIWQIYFAQVSVWQQSSQSAARDIQEARKSRLNVSTMYTQVIQADYYCTSSRYFPQQRESKLCHDMVMCKNHWRVQIQHFDNLSYSSSLYFYIAFLLKFRNEHVNTMSRYLAWECWLSRCCDLLCNIFD